MSSIDVEACTATESLRSPGSLDPDVTGAGPEVQRSGVVQLDVADADLATALAEAADRLQGGRGVCALRWRA